uniref:Uncharacterized protein n=1 Tax=Cannabis sativa TaxID=3483 RepID=A0A803R4Z5_CANSA
MELESGREKKVAAGRSSPTTSSVGQDLLLRPRDEPIPSGRENVLGETFFSDHGNQSSMAPNAHECHLVLQKLQLRSSLMRMQQLSLLYNCGHHQVKIIMLQQVKHENVS